MADDAIEITGTVKLGRSTSIECVCCEGSHIYSVDVALDTFKSVYPKHFKMDVENWIYSNFPLKHMEGRRIRITAEIIDE